MNTAMIGVCACVDGWVCERECHVSALNFRKLDYLTTVLQGNGWQMF